MTKKERKIMQNEARLLRNRMDDIVDQWIIEKQNDKSITDEQIKIIEQEVYSKLIWRILEKKERYNNRFFNKLFETLKVEHPNLTVHNEMKCFVSWPVFNKEDIEACIDNSIEPLFFEKRENEE